MMIKMIWDNYDGDDDDIDNENDDDDDDDVIETAPSPLIGTIDLGTGRPWLDDDLDDDDDDEFDNDDQEKDDGDANI